MGRKASFESLLRRLYVTGVDAQGVPEWLHALKAPFNSHITSVSFTTWVIACTMPCTRRTSVPVN
jgi:hypothetical protein